MVYCYNFTKEATNYFYRLLIQINILLKQIFSKFRAAIENCRSCYTKPKHQTPAIFAIKSISFLKMSLAHYFYSAKTP
jgi:hypothetical protein